MTRQLLYVDDDPDIRVIVELALQLDGQFVPTLAASGEEAIAIVTAGMSPDIVVLDVMMPGMDGLMLLDRLRPLLPASVPILFMTARGRQSDLSLFRQRGAAGVLVKPFDPVRLGADIRAIVDPDDATTAIVGRWSQRRPQPDG